MVKGDGLQNHTIVGSNPTIYSKTSIMNIKTYELRDFNLNDFIQINNKDFGYDIMIENKRYWLYVNKNDKTFSYINFTYKNNGNTEVNVIEIFV